MTVEFYQKEILNIRLPYSNNGAQFPFLTKKIMNTPGEDGKLNGREHLLASVQLRLERVSSDDMMSLEEESLNMAEAALSSSSMDVEALQQVAALPHFPFKDGLADLLAKVGAKSA